MIFKTKLDKTWKIVGTEGNGERNEQNGIVFGKLVLSLFVRLVKYPSLIKFTVRDKGTYFGPAVIVGQALDVQNSVSVP